MLDMWQELNCKQDVVLFKCRVEGVLCELLADKLLAGSSCQHVASKEESWGQGLKNPQRGPPYFRLFKEKQWPSLFRHFCSEAIQ